MARALRDSRLVVPGADISDHSSRLRLVPRPGVKGGEWIHAYTDKGRFDAALPGTKERDWPMGLGALMDTQEAEASDGIVVNPGSDTGFSLPRASFDAMRKALAHG